MTIRPCAIPDSNQASRRTVTHGAAPRMTARPPSWRCLGFVSRFNAPSHSHDSTLAAYGVLRMLSMLDVIPVYTIQSRQPDRSTEGCLFDSKPGMRLGPSLFDEAAGWYHPDQFGLALPGQWDRIL